MTEDTIALRGLMQKSGDSDFLREMIGFAAQRISTRSVAVTVAVNTDGRRGVLGLAVGPSEAEVFWTDFLRGLARRGASSWWSPTPRRRSPNH